MAEIDLSYATIVSIFPKEVKESKPGLYPSEYIIPKGTATEPGLLIISNDVHHLVNPDPLSEDKEIRYIKVAVKAIEAAQSIIQDYVNSLIEVTDDGVPGLFAVKGDYKDPKLVIQRFAHEIHEYSKAQYRWFTNLAKSGDEIWAKTRSTAGISDLQRIAAENIKWGKDWLIRIDEPSKCPFCKNSINEGALKCVTCGEILNTAEYNRIKDNVTNEAKNPLGSSFAK